MFLTASHCAGSGALGSEICCDSPEVHWNGQPLMVEQRIVSNVRLLNLLVNCLQAAFITLLLPAKQEATRTRRRSAIPFILFSSDQ